MVEQIEPKMTKFLHAYFISSSKISPRLILTLNNLNVQEEHIEQTYGPRKYSCSFLGPAQNSNLGWLQQ